MWNAKAIILVGNRDFGRCPIASHLPTALWPITGKSALDNLLTHLAEQGIKKAVICGSNASSLLGNKNFTDDRLALSFFDELLPVGTAGCLREAVSDGSEELLVVFPAGIVCPPNIDVLIKAHQEGGSDLTAMLNPYSYEDVDIGDASGIFVCNPDVVKHIPEDGYFDIKEGLIPKIIQDGGTVHAATLPYHAGNFRNRQEYLCAISDSLENIPKLKANLKLRKGPDAQNVWISESAIVDPEAKIEGPVIIMDGVTISSGAVVLGPTILGKNVTIDKGSIVVNSVLWDDAHVGSNCQVCRCVVGYHGYVRDTTIVEDESVLFKPLGMFGSKVRNVSSIVKNDIKRLRTVLRPIDKIFQKLPKSLQLSRKNILAFLVSGFVVVTFLWSYWPGIIELGQLWKQSDEYSSGFLVPFLAVYILWSRRDDIAHCPIQPSLWGLFAFVGAQAVRLFGLFFMYSSAERLSIVLSIASLILLIFGWKVFRKVSPILLFLCLMLPLPNVIQYYVGLNLQQWATSSAVFCLEMIGYPVVQEGHTIEIGNVSVAVLEACNGLRMITAFFVISGLVVLLVERTWWEKLVILVSSLPIALLCNTLRLTVTAIFFTILKGEYWEKVFHDFGGYAMMPLALAIVVGELWFLTKLTVFPTEEKAIIITRHGG